MQQENLYVDKGLEHADKEQAAQLKHWITVTDFDPAEKIEAVTGLYNRIGVKLLVKTKCRNTTTRLWRAWLP